MIWAGLVTLVVGAAVTIWSAAGSGDSGSGPEVAGIIVLVLGGLMVCAGLLRRHRRRATRRADGVVAEPGRPGVGGPRPATNLRDAVYRTSRGRMAAMVVAAVYILSPIDLIPDFLLPVGIVDDATALGWLIFAVSREYGRRRARSPQPVIGVEAAEPYEAAPPRPEAQIITPPSKRSPR